MGKLSSKIWTFSWNFFQRFPILQRLVVKNVYELISIVQSDGQVTFMNYGYAYAKKDDDLKLNISDEINRYPIQMYHHVGSQVDLKDSSVLEVGSGRGGGAAYIFQYLHPISVIGVDISDKAVEFCRSKYHFDGLSFFPGDAERLNYSDNTFDAVLNIESMGHYGNIQQFLNEVKRILKPGGHLMLADELSPRRIPKLRMNFKNARLKLIKQEDITQNVVLAINLGEERRLKLIKPRTPKFLLGFVKEFAAMKGSKKYQALKKGESKYYCFLLQKQKPN